MNFVFPALGLVLLAALAQFRALPAQNVAMILASLAAFEAVLESVLNSHFALGWTGLLFWPATIVLARIGCRWILRRWKQDWNYGIWLVVIASVTVALVQFEMACIGLPWTVAIKLSSIRLIATAFCLVSLSPWFISKLAKGKQTSHGNLSW